MSATMPPSEIWKYYIKIDKATARCKICGVIVNSFGNTVNLWNHQERKHNLQRENQKRKRSITISSTSSSTKSDEDPDVPSPLSPLATEQASNNDIIICSSHLNLIRFILNLFFIFIAQIQTITDYNPSLLFNTSSTSTRNTSTVLTNNPPPTKTVKSNIRNLTLIETLQKAKPFSESGHMTRTLNEALMFMVIKDHLPLDFVEGPGFKYFSKKAIPLYKVPSRRTFTRLLDAKYDILSARMQDIFTKVQRFNLTADIWTDKHTNSYLGVTVHFLSGCEMITATISVTPLDAPHDIQYISKMLEKTCHEWDIDKDKIKHIVTDNAANIVAATKNVFGPFKHVGCFAHMLNLVTEKAIEATPGLSDLINKVKSIVTFFKHSVNASDQLKAIQLQNGRTEGTLLKLIQSVSTRWNSTFAMIDRFIELSDIVGTLLLKYQNVNMLSGNELLELKELSRVLKPFDHATRDLSSEKTTSISKIIPMINLMKQLLVNIEVPVDASVTIALKKQLVKQIDIRFGQAENVETFALATILDPRFKKMYFRESLAHARAVSKLTAKITEMQRTEAKLVAEPSTLVMASDVENLWSLHDIMVASTSSQELNNFSDNSEELRLYLNSPLATRDTNPLQVWETLKEMYPHLYQIARDYLSRVATSVPAERLFSKAGSTATERRNRLTGKRLSKLLFMASLEESFFF
ncbi:PREDICTED: zinc finger BED domain-containing protein 4-like [Trachymyrmex cornetzi]|uniref:zinc finger BED domain-containing protein 4-like n=1 Tax=Trachymyrmex cornetzi TaxID=471704 RepID=UPI00084EF297|nr:PREDICTED: zinc finger BED domain-containing protein 4-like [Trachymyrmex cornetzi]